MSKARIGSAVATILFLGVAIVVALNVQYIQDLVRYRQYQPSHVMTAFVSDTGMSDYGEFLFFTSHPSLESRETFNLHCESRERMAAILGCYDGWNIYIYDIADPRLNGIRETTAAHEMLHAGYRRLSDDDEQMVNRLLNLEYEKLRGDEKLSERMAFYARTQPGERENELHSIIGTEVANVSPELEEYYSRYFSDRQKVVQAHQRYYSVFEELREQASALSAQINALSSRIESQKAAYTEQAIRLQRDVDSFNIRAEQGGFQTQAEFTRERQALLARVTAVEDLRTAINNAITEHSRLVDEVNAIAIETEELNRSIDSKLAPAPSL